MDKELIEMLLNDKDFRKDAVEDIRRMMDEEMAKSPHKRDYQKIAQLSHDYCELMGMTDEVEQTSATGIQEVLRNSRKLKIQPSKRTTRIFSILLVAAVLAVANTITVFAVNENIVSFIVNRAENGFSVTPVPETVIELPTSEDDPYGIRAECAKYGLDVEVPTYLPEGFVLWDVDEHESIAEKIVTFWFKRDKIHLKFSYAELYNENAKMGIPSDEFNLEEIRVNGKSAITSKEDGQYNLIYYDGNMEYFMTSDYLSYEECDKIVASIK